MRLRPIADAAVPATVLELRSQYGLAEGSEPRIVFQKVDAEAEPEPEVAEIDASEHERPIDGLAVRHEATEQPFDRLTPRWVAFGESAFNEQEQRPR